MYEFPKKLKSLKYHENQSFALHKNLILLHNKSRIRKLITDLQILFKERVGIPLDATAIRDNYLKKKYSDKYLILLCAELEKEKELDIIIEKYENIQLKSGAYEIEVTIEFTLLKAIDFKGFERGINTLKIILEQTFSNYFKDNEFEKYVQIPSLSILDEI